MNGEHTVMSDISASGWDLLWVLFLAAGLYASMRALRFAIDLVPITGERREALRRAFPLVSAGVTVVYLLFATGFLFDRYPQHFPIAVAVIFAVSIAASWFAVMDLVSGVFIKAGRVCRVGDYVRIGDIHGRVGRMGHRVLVVETARGEEAIIPYSRVSREAVLRTSVAEHGTLHVFKLSLPDRPPVAATKRAIREAALSCHWAAVARDPQIAVVDGERYEVTVFALDPDHVRDVEAAVRRSLSESAPPD